MFLLKIELRYYSAANKGTEYCAMSTSVCPSVSVCPRAYLRTTRPIFARFLCVLPAAMARSSSGGVNYDTLCTSGFMDDTMSAHNGSYGGISILL